MGNPDGPTVFEPDPEVAKPDSEEHTALREAALKMYDEVAPSVVGIRINGREAASGFFADSHGGVLTNSHVVTAGKIHEIVTHDGVIYPAKVVRLDDINDLALLRIDGVSSTPGSVLERNSTEDTTNLRAFAIGHPAGLRQTVITPGRMTGPTSGLKFMRYTYSSARASHSNVNTGISLYDIPGGAEEIISSVVGGMPNPKRDETADWLRRPILEGRVNLIGGNSGGPLVDEHMSVLGVSSCTNMLSGQSGFVPTEQVEQFLSQPEEKFKFGYSYQMRRDWVNNYVDSWSDAPVINALTTASTAAGAYACGVAFNRATPPRYWPTAAVLGGGMLLYNDVGEFNTFGGLRNVVQDSASILSDVAMMSGGVLRMTGKYRSLGTALVGFGTAGRLGAEFIPTRPVLEKIERQNGDTRPPQELQEMAKSVGR